MAVPGSMAEFEPRREAAVPTPGPWTVTTDPTGRTGPLICADARVVAHVSVQHGETEANARLIAAAPDMAALLLEVRDFLDNYVDVVDGENGPRPNTAMALDMAVRDLLDRAGVAHGA